MRTGAASVLGVGSVVDSVPVVLVLSAADAAVLSQLLTVAQQHILEVAATSEDGGRVNARLPRLLRSWASSAADLRERLNQGVTDESVIG